jgi:hypothetical protein
MQETETNMKTKKESFHLYNQDGVIDIISAAVLLNFGLDLLKNSETTSIFTWVPILLISSLKDRITNSRLSPEELGTDNKTIRKWTFIPAVVMILSLTLLGTFVLGDPLNIQATGFLSFSGDALSLAASLVLSLVWIISGLLTGLKRFYIYAGVALIAGLISSFFFPLYVPFFLTAAVILVLGAVLMVKFTKAYPIIEKEEADEN